MNIRILFFLLLGYGFVIQAAPISILKEKVHRNWKELREERKQLIGATVNQDYQEKRRLLKAPSIAEFLHLEKIHKEGWTGKGVDILVLEDSGAEVSALKCNYEVDPWCSKSLVLHSSHRDHGTNVASVIAQVAPDAKMYVSPPSLPTKILSTAQIVNLSFGWSPDSHAFRMAKHTLIGLLQDNDRLLVKAAGNEGQPLSTANSEIALIFKDISPTSPSIPEHLKEEYKIYQHMIIAGKIDYTLQPSLHSNTPSTPTLQKIFLMVLGKLPVLGGDTGHH